MISIGHESETDLETINEAKKYMDCEKDVLKKEPEYKKLEKFYKTFEEGLNDMLNLLDDGTTYKLKVK